MLATQTLFSPFPTAGAAIPSAKSTSPVLRGRITLPLSEQRREGQVAASAIGEIGGCQVSFRHAYSKQPAAPRLRSMTWPLNMRRRVDWPTPPFSGPWFRKGISFQSPLKEKVMCVLRKSGREGSAMATLLLLVETIAIASLRCYGVAFPAHPVSCSRETVQR